ncbi:MAG: hypothetical protein KF739_07500 [Cryobacterium sp.]|nr:hypothetical protein [Cryobacterium sp.]
MRNLRHPRGDQRRHRRRRRDVINFSIGGGAAQTTITDQAFLNAAAAGIFVSASAELGPGYSTLDNASP